MGISTRLIAEVIEEVKDWPDVRLMVASAEEASYEITARTFRKFGFQEAPQRRGLFYLAKADNQNWSAVRLQEAA